MAKRRLDPPSPEALAAMDEEFRSETPARRTAAAPIAQVAGDAALAGSAETPAAKLDRQDAEQLRAAKEQGLVILEIPLAQVTTDAMVRDRVVHDPADLIELAESIRANGQRLPIEVTAEPNGTYALVSGFRRLSALKMLAVKTPETFGKVKALVRPAEGLEDWFQAMVEENEVRADLSQFERGRIAVLATKHADFADVGAAINHLFAFASKAKRSKIRKFADIFEALGDVLRFPEAITERQGLRIAGALRTDDGQTAMRDALVEAAPETADAEWAALLPVVERLEQVPTTATKMGRPKAKQSKKPWAGREVVDISDTLRLVKDRDGDGFVIRLSGSEADEEKLAVVFAEVERVLGKHK